MSLGREMGKDRATNAFGTNDGFLNFCLGGPDGKVVAKLYRKIAERRQV